MGKIRLSFIIPVYQVAEYLGQCLASVSAQRLEEMEAWVIDDGSTDGCAEICDEWAGRDPRFHVVHTPNQGVSAARNLGMERASGEWVCFVDGDDWIERDFTERLAFDDYEDADIVLFGYSFETAQGRIHAKRNHTNIGPLSEIDINCIISRLLDTYSTRSDAMIDYWNYRTPWGQMYRADYLDNNNLKYIRGMVLGEDMVLNLDAYLCGPRVYRSTTMEYYYRDNKSSITHRYNTAIANAFQRRNQEIQSVLLRHHRMREFQEQFNVLLIQSMQSCTRLDYCHPDNPLPFSQRRAGFLKLRNSSSIEVAFQNAKLPDRNYNTKCILIFMKWKLFLAVDIIFKLRTRRRLQMRCFSHCKLVRLH